MKKNLAVNISFLLIIAGMIIVLNASRFGSSVGSATLSAQGSMDTTQYYNLITSETTNFRVVGIMLFSLGALGAFKSIDFEE